MGEIVGFVVGVWSVELVERKRGKEIEILKARYGSIVLPVFDRFFNM